MSVSPPLRRLSSTSTSSKESLINAYEAEEERIINILSRKLEQVCPSVSDLFNPDVLTRRQLREEKIELENALEAESENHVNRLSREISALRLAQQAAVNGSGSLSPVETRLPGSIPSNPLEPSAEVMLDAMRRENEQLRGRLIETERDYIRISRLNEIYREELIEHRRRVSFQFAFWCIQHRCEGYWPFRGDWLVGRYANSYQAWSTSGRSHRSLIPVYGPVVTTIAPSPIYAVFTGYYPSIPDYNAFCARANPSSSLANPSAITCAPQSVYHSPIIFLNIVALASHLLARGRSQ